ncbi:MAG: hypothetical protein NTX15_06635 [Candidatus Kapabacteria bacterium]|nr:hypothetical protein [Candidatus Kapabacteria bacterium]
MSASWRGIHAFCIPVIALSAILSSCNDLPTSVGSEVVPGTDTIYALSSLQAALFTADSTSSVREPLVNGAYFLIGNTPTDQARVFMEFINYPNAGADSTYDIVNADLEMYPQEYRYGDTTDRTVAFSALELKKSWSANVTWDSIWAADGSTDYYSLTDYPVSTFSGSVTTPADTVLRVPFDKDAVKRWMVAGRDSVLVKDVFGIVLLPTNTSVIRQFRNLRNVLQVMKLRVITKQRDTSQALDTFYVESAVSSLVNTPAAQAGELVVQGARVHRSLLRISLDSVPKNSVIIGGTLRISVNNAASQYGLYGRDEVVSLRYVPPTGSVIELASRGDSSGVYVFTNIGPLLQLIRRSGGSADLYVKPSGIYDSWRMNRLRFYTLADDPSLRPRVTVAYTIPGVFAK